MTDFGYDEVLESDRADFAPFVGAKPSAGLKRLTSRTAALLSIALIVGMAVWGYQIALRQARGVPVVRAEAGAMRVKPEDPGGARVAYQGLAVNNVAAEGEVAAPPERSILAPRPVELSADDVAGYAPMPAWAVVPSLTPTIPAPRAMEEEGTSTAAFEGDADLVAQEPDAGAGLPEASPMAAAPAIAAEADPEVALSDAIQAVQIEVTALLTTVAEDAVINTSPAAIATSIRPQPRPKPASAGASVNLLAAAAPSAADPPVDAATLSAGTRLVQLGAYDDAAAASRDWVKLVGQYAVYFEGKRPVIQKAESGGKTFFRLRALGFDDEDAARRFCAVLLNDRAQCIPVLTRG